MENKFKPHGFATLKISGGGPDLKFIGRLSLFLLFELRVRFVEFGIEKNGRFYLRVGIERTGWNPWHILKLRAHPFD